MKKPIVFLSLLLAVSLTSCADEATNVNLNSGHEFGTYQGTVMVYGTGGDSGIVIMEGDNTTSYSRVRVTVAIPGTPYTTTTDSSGNYMLPHVPLGTHNLIYTKPGYDTVMILGDRLTRTDTTLLPTQHLQKIPFDSLVITQITYWKDSMLVDTIAGKPHFDTAVIMQLFVKSFGPDTITRASVSITRVDSSGNKTVLGSHFAQLWAQGGEQLLLGMWDAQFLHNPKTALHRGDKIIIMIRAASAPMLNLPVVFSPYVTQAQAIVKPE